MTKHVCKFISYTCSDAVCTKCGEYCRINVTVRLCDDRLIGEWFCHTCGYMGNNSINDCPRMTLNKFILLIS